MIKKLKGIKSVKIDNHWTKKLSNGRVIGGCTIKRNKPVKHAK